MHNNNTFKLSARRIPKNDISEFFGTNHSDQKNAVEKLNHIDTQNLDKIRASKLAAIDEEIETIRTVRYQEIKKELDGFEVGKRSEVSAKISREIMLASQSLIDDFENNHTWISDLIINSTKKIIGTFEKTDIISRIIYKGIEETRERWRLRIRVHPDNLESIQSQISKDNGNLANAVHIVLSDNTIGTDGCIIESQSGIANLNLNIQLKQLEQIIAEHLHLLSNKEKNETQLI